MRLPAQTTAGGPEAFPHNCGASRTCALRVAPEVLRRGASRGRPPRSTKAASRMAAGAPEAVRVDAACYPKGRWFPHSCWNPRCSIVRVKAAWLRVPCVVAGAAPQWGILTGHRSRSALVHIIIIYTHWYMVVPCSCLCTHASCTTRVSSAPKHVHV